MRRAHPNDPRSRAPFAVRCNLVCGTCKVSYAAPAGTFAHQGGALRRSRTECSPTAQQSSRRSARRSCRLPIRSRRPLSCGLRRSNASRANRIWPAWRHRVASYRLRRSSAKLGRLARRKKQRARSAVGSTAGSPDFGPGLCTDSDPFVTPGDIGSNAVNAVRFRPPEQRIDNFSRRKANSSHWLPKLKDEIPAANRYQG